MLSLVPELLVNIAHIGKLTRRIQTLADSNGQYRLRRHWRVRKDEKALAARSGVDDSLRGRRGGDADRRLLLAVLDGRVTAYSKQATAKRTRAAGTQRLSRCVAMWCDAQRRVVERCDAPRRAALPTVMSISPTRPIDQPNMVGCEATSRQRSCRSRHLFRIASPCSSQDPPRVRTHAAESSLRRPRRVSPRGHRTEPENPCASIHRSTRRAPARAIA
jgi:hypothetical protein